MGTIGEITEIISSFKELSGVGVCFYDLDDFFTYNEGGRLEYLGHYCDFCKRVRQLVGGRTLCDKSDRKSTVETAHKFKTPFFTKCHMGLCELAVPIYFSDTLKGLIFLGQCRIENEDARSEIIKNAQNLGGDGDEFVKLYEALPVLSRKNLLSMGKILQLYFSTLTKASDFFTAKNRAELSSRPLCARIKEYVEKNYASDITSKSIAELFFVNQSYMAREFKKAHGCTVTDFILSVRIENAKKLLLDTNATVRSIALNTGFSDSNYFTRVFKSREGISPTEFVKRAKR